MRSVEENSSQMITASACKGLFGFGTSFDHFYCLMRFHSERNFSRIANKSEVVWIWVGTPCVFVCFHNW